MQADRRLLAGGSPVQKIHYPAGGGVPLHGDALSHHHLLRPVLQGKFSYIQLFLNHQISLAYLHETVSFPYSGMVLCVIKSLADNV